VRTQRQQTAAPETETSGAVLTQEKDIFMHFVNAFEGKETAWSERLNRLRVIASRWAPLPIRLIIGYGFMAHGVAKIIKGPDAFAAILYAIHVPMPHLTALVTIALELICGFAILVGAFVPLMSLPMAAILLVATFSVHLQYGFSSIKLIAVTAAGAQFGPPGYETDLLYLAGIATLVMAGAGPFAFDNLRKVKNGPR
jgi:putative oxidoreductase